MSLAHHSHFLYLEDDIHFTDANLRYWLAARPVLAPLGLLPGFVRFEQMSDGQYLVDQTRSGQHVAVLGGSRDLEGVRVRFRRSLRPYQAMLLLDVPLLRAHLRASPMRSPLRSRIVDWGVRERAAAGATLGPTERPLLGLRNPDADGARPRSRLAVPLVDSTAEYAAEERLLPGACIRHLRATHAPNPRSKAGKVLLKDF